MTMSQAVALPPIGSDLIIFHESTSVLSDPLYLIEFSDPLGRNNGYCAAAAIREDSSVSVATHKDPLFS